MKPLSHLILLFFVVFMLSACDSEDEVVQVVSTVTPGVVETAVLHHLEDTRDFVRIVSPDAVVEMMEVMG